MRIARICYVTAIAARIRNVELDDFIPYTKEEREQKAIERLRNQMLSWAKQSQMKETN